MARLVFFISVFCLLSACGGSYKKTDTGLKYKFHIKNQGTKKANIGEMMYLHYNILDAKGKELFSTYVNRNGAPDVITLETPYYKGDYFEALSMMSIGDSATFLINADSFYIRNLGRPLPKEIKSGSKLVFNIRLEDIMSAKASEEQINKEKWARFNKEYAEMVAYMEKNNWTMQTTAEGIKHNITKSANLRIKEGDTVVMHYKGRLLNDNEFINTYVANQPQPFVVGSENPVPFYNMILPLMGDKEKGVFIIPYLYAFEDRVVKDKVPPYSTVIYEIEILEVKKQK